MALSKIPAELREKFEIHEWRSASAVLMSDYPQHWEDITQVLSSFALLKSHVVVGGGRKSKIAASIDAKLEQRGWSEKQFSTSINVDQNTYASPTHRVDCFKAGDNPGQPGVGLEIEWNNKDPFFDRDLNNFRLLFELRAIAVGVIVTRADHLQEIFNELTKRRLKPASAYGDSTTHMGKLLPRLEGGAGGGCPILAFGITKQLYIEDLSDDAARALLKEIAAEKKRRKAGANTRDSKTATALDQDPENTEESDL